MCFHVYKAIYAIYRGTLLDCHTLYDYLGVILLLVRVFLKVFRFPTIFVVRGAGRLHSSLVRGARVSRDHSRNDSTNDGSRTYRARCHYGSRGCLRGAFRAFSTFLPFEELLRGPMGFHEVTNGVLPMGRAIDGDGGDPDTVVERPVPVIEVPTNKESAIVTVPAAVRTTTPVAEVVSPTPTGGIDEGNDGTDIAGVPDAPPGGPFVEKTTGAEAVDTEVVPTLFYFFST